MANPYLFVSHKHRDSKIGGAVADFLNKRSAGHVPIHLSSNPDFEGPRAGQSLNDALREALARTSVLVLVYTDDSLDWSYCMWECGVATDPSDATATRVIVLQCGEDSPSTYGDHVRVDARDRTSVHGFVADFLTSPDFFPGYGQPLTGFSRDGKEVQDATDELFDQLGAVRPSGQAVARHATPFLQIELESQAVETIATAASDDRWRVAAEQLLASGRIGEFDKAEIVFGRDLKGAMLGAVVEDWEPGSQPDDFFGSVAQQVVDAVERSIPGGIVWAPYEGKGGNRIPILTESRELPDCWQFDFHLVPLEPPSQPASERMLRIEDAFYKVLEPGQEAEINLVPLAKEMDASGHTTRVPILDGHQALRYIVHRSMIDKYIASYAMAGQGVTDLSLADMLKDDRLAEMFTTAVATVSIDATIEEARTAMMEVSGQDVFVTEDGTPESPVVGWLPNVEFVKDH